MYDGFWVWVKQKDDKHPTQPYLTPADNIADLLKRKQHPDFDFSKIKTKELEISI